MKKLIIAVFAASIMFYGSAILKSAPTSGNDFHVGNTNSNQDIELYSGALRPCTDGGVDLGSSSNKFGTLYVGTISATTMSATTVSATNLTVSTLTATIGIVDISITSPTAVGMLVINSTGTLYISTSAVSLKSWVPVGTQL